MPDLRRSDRPGKCDSYVSKGASPMRRTTEPVLQPVFTRSPNVSCPWMALAFGDHYC